MSIKFTSITSGGIEIPIWDESAHSAFSNYYTKTQTDDLLHGRVVVVQTLPVTGEEGIIYYVGPLGDKDDKYEEYIWTSTESRFIKVGERSVDLSDYQPISGMSAYATKVDMEKANGRIETNSANIGALETWKETVTPIVAGVISGVTNNNNTLTFTKVDGSTTAVTITGGGGSTYSAGENIAIENDVISVSGTRSLYAQEPLMTGMSGNDYYIGCDATNLIAGDNITFTETTQGLEIAAQGGGIDWSVNIEDI